MHKTIFVLYLLLLCWQTSLLAQKQERDQAPKIGLALSGGGAKGIAHIGVLKVLEEAGIRPDYITGTSIGSIMGGLYAIGYSVEEMEQLATGIDWNYYFNDELKRTDAPIEERHLADRYQLKFGIEKNKIQFPKGFVQGQKIGLLLSYLTFPAHGIKNFDYFPIPFRCVATDAETGEKVVIKHGSLAKAMRASMSLPSIFEPMEMDGKVLLDGGVVQNLPVQEAFDMGADIVIAVDITSPLYKRKDLISLIHVLEQTSSYKLSEGVAVQRELADIVIAPATQEYGTLEFSAADTLLQLGEQAARAKLADILALVNTQQAPGKQHSPEHVSVPNVCKVCAVKIQGIAEKRQNTIANVMQMRNDREYPIEVIEKRIKQLFGGHFFRDAYYELIPASDGYDLNIDAAVKSGEYLQASINHDSDLKAAILLNATFRNRGLNGSKFGLDVKVSENPMIAANYQVYTTSQPNFGIRFSGMLDWVPFHLYNNKAELDRISKYCHSRAWLSLFSSYNNTSLLSGGIGIERLSKRDEIFSRRSEDIGLNITSLHVEYLNDTYDRAQFAKKGSYLKLEGRLALDHWSRFSSTIIDPPELDNITQSLQLRYSKILPLSKMIALKLDVDGGISRFDNEGRADNLLSMFYLGRSVPQESSFVEFVGRDYMEQPATEYWLAGLKLRAEPIPNIFTSMMFNCGQYRSRRFAMIDDGLVSEIAKSSGTIFGLGWEFGFVTPIGPGRMAAELNPQDGTMHYVMHLGYIF